MIRPLERVGVKAVQYGPSDFLDLARAGRRVDVLLTDIFGYAPGYLRFLSGSSKLPYVIRLRGDYWSEIGHSDPRSVLECKLGDWGLSRAGAILPVSRYLSSLVCRRFPTLEARVESVHTPVDCDRFRPGLPPDPFRKRFGIPGDAIVILMMANMHFKGKVNGILHFLPALARVARENPKALICIGGWGRYSGFLGEIIQNTSKRTRWLGYLTPAEYAIAGADIIAYTSFFDTLGMSVLEAQSCGMPVVANEIGGVGEVIADGRTGFLVGPTDLEGFRLRIQALIDDEQLRRQIGRSAREFAVRSYSFPATGTRIKEILLRTIRNRERQVIE